MNKILKIVWIIWGLPQNLVGFAMATWFKVTKKVHREYFYKDSKVFHVNHPKLGGAVSLGTYILVFSEYGSTEKELIKHEYGHSIQSKILGPLYLIVIGLPSIIWAGLFDNFRRKHGLSYYWFYPERWANYLGGVDKNRI